ncbi:hypothetical protein [Streptosporangium sp. NPDC049046]|uniref:hypothetical protein n=1 Tax=Streptosporangium sp. NPDC049046 TaxID=3155031 RepID=UPI00344853E8
MLPRTAYDADGRGHEQTSRGRAYRDVIQMYAAWCASTTLTTPAAANGTRPTRT